MYLPRPQLRQLINQLLRTDSELDAFLIDYLPDVHRRTSGGMDRTQKVNVLLQFGDGEHILAALQQADPGKFLTQVHMQVLRAGARPQPSPVSAEATDMPLPGTPLGDILVTRGTPRYTYIEPAQMQRLKAALRTKGQTVLVEGPAGSGKTSLVDQALADPQLRLSDVSIKLSTRSDRDREVLDEIFQTDLQPGRFVVVDDFHHLDLTRKQRVANLVKLMADRSRSDAKLILIGINPLGDSLLSQLPDARGCFTHIPLRRQPIESLNKLLETAESVTRLRFRHGPELMARAEGSFALAQWLLLLAAQQTGFYVVPDTQQAVDAGFAEVLDSVLTELRGSFGALLSTFAGYDHDQPGAGACRRLLQELARSDAAIVRLEELRYQDPDLTRSFDWLASSKLSTLLESNPGLAGLFYYHREVKTLAIEDPFLQFYLRNLQPEEFPGPTRMPVLSVAVAGAPDRQPLPLIEIPPLPLQMPVKHVRVLHLSDLHFTSDEQVIPLLHQLESDLRSLLSGEPLHAVVLSGDITETAQPEEYQAAARFVRELMGTFNLTAGRLVLVPGNHDIDWVQSKRSYLPRWLRRGEDESKLRNGTFLWLSQEKNMKSIAERRDDDYRLRLKPFADFYDSLRGAGYSMEYGEQSAVQHLPDEGLVFLSLNSAWYTDHAFPERAGVNEQAFAQALRQIEQTEAYGPCLKLAVMHHPPRQLQSQAGLDAACLEQLAKAGFRILLHGHVHEADNQLFRYHGDTPKGRIEIVAAGTFAGDRTPGYPFQYQLLDFAGPQLTVHTRKREKPGGAWKPDARWSTDGQGNVAASYPLDLGS